jgi:hypothetical protein
VSDITGTKIDVFVTDGGDVTQPEDFSKAIVAALVPNTGGYTVYPASMRTVDGKFTIPSVPDGPYYLRIVTQGFDSYVLTSSRVLDLSGVIMGRPGAFRILAPTSLSFSGITGLRAWEAGDPLQLFSSNAGASGFLIGAYPSAGATTWTGTQDYSRLYDSSEIDGSQGDRATIAQFIFSTSGNITYDSLVKVFMPGAFTIKSGQPASIASGSFQDVAQTTTAVTWNRSAFASMVTAVHSLATVDTNGFNIYAEAAGSNRRTSTPSPALAYGYDSQTSDVALNLTYGNPYPPSWSVMGEAYTRFAITLGLPSGNSVIVQAYIDVAGPLATFAAGPIVPPISPVQSLEVNGTSTATPILRLTNTTPTVSWSVPLTGTSSHYLLNVEKIDTSSAPLGVQSVAQINTTELSVTIPPNLLTAGSYYVFLVTATTDAYDSSQPFRYTYPYATATAVTGVIAP